MSARSGDAISAAHTCELESVSINYISLSERSMVGPWSGNHWRSAHMSQDSVQRDAVVWMCGKGFLKTTRTRSLLDIASQWREAPVSDQTTRAKLREKIFSPHLPTVNYHRGVINCETRKPFGVA